MTDTAIKTQTLLLSNEQARVVFDRLLHVAASYDPTSVLHSVNFQTIGDTLKVCATDGSRMATFQDTMHDASGPMVNWNVPSSLLLQLKKAAPRKTVGALIIKVDGAYGREVTLTLDGTSVSGTLNPNEYPRYDELFPVEFEREICFNPEFLAEATKGSGGYIVMSTNGELKPAVFQDHDKRVKHLLMPIQKKSAEAAANRKPANRKPAKRR